MALKDLIATPKEGEMLHEAHSLRQEIERLRHAIRHAGVGLDQGVSHETVSEWLREAISRSNDR